MSNLQTIENRIVSIAKLKGLSKNKLLTNANLSKSIFDNMKRGQIPSVDKIEAIADYLDCSVDYLLGRADSPTIPETSNTHDNSAQNPQSNVLLDIFNELDPANQAKLLVYAGELKKQHPQFK